ncbi:hypothetical protein YC2023_093516 [Brassica napus]
MLLVRACGAETFVSWTLLERAGVQRHTVLATLRIIYPYEEMRSWEFYLLQSVVCVFSIPIPHGVTPLLLTPPIPFPFQLRLTSRSDCYRIGALGNSGRIPIKWGRIVTTVTRFLFKPIVV